MAPVKIDGKWGYIDRTGKVIIPCKYAWAYYFKSGHAHVERNGKYGFVDKTGREVVPCKYDIVQDDFCEGFTKSMINGKYRFVDKKGNPLLLK